MDSAVRCPVPVGLGVGERVPVGVHRLGDGGVPQPRLHALGCRPTWISAEGRRRDVSVAAVYAPELDRWCEFDTLVINGEQRTDDTYAEVDRPGDHRQTCRVMLSAEWVFIKVTRSDSDNVPRFDAYPASQVTVLGLHDDDITDPWTMDEPPS